jgi:hypothetical protein
MDTTFPVQNGRSYFWSARWYVVTREGEHLTPDRVRGLAAAIAAEMTGGGNDVRTLVADDDQVVEEGGKQVHRWTLDLTFWGEPAVARQVTEVVEAAITPVTAAAFPLSLVDL